MHLANYIGYLHRAELNLAQGMRKVGEAHMADTDVYHTTATLARQCEAHAAELRPFVERNGEDAPTEPDRLYHQLFDGTREGGLGLLRDLHDLYIMASACDIAWTMIGQAAQGARDAELLAVVESCEVQTATQIRWVKTRMKQAAPQALLIAP